MTPTRRVADTNPEQLVGQLDQGAAPQATPSEKVLNAIGGAGAVAEDQASSRAQPSSGGLPSLVRRGEYRRRTRPGRRQSQQDDQLCLINTAVEILNTPRPQLAGSRDR
jgi:hypothetical protein